MQAGSVRGAGRGKVEITVIDVTGTGYRQCPVTGSTLTKAVLEVYHEGSRSASIAKNDSASRSATALVYRKEDVSSQGKGV